MADDVSIRDPHNVPTVFVNDIAGAGFLNGNVNLTFITARWTPLTGGTQTVDADLVVSARLRMDLYCAQQLYDAIGDIIAKQTKTVKS